MDLFNIKDFDFPELVDPLLFQDKVKEFFDNNHLEGYTVIQGNGEYINNAFINGIVYLAPGAEIKPYSVIEGRVVIGKDTSIGPQCSIKGDVVIGRDCHLGRCEIDNSIIMNDVKAYHHSYIGHSIVGNKVNIAAGFITANLRFDEAAINVKYFGQTNCRKYGALLGDGVKTMINASLMPGSVVSPGSTIFSSKPTRMIGSLL